MKTRGQNSLVNSIDASAPIDAWIRLALILFRETLAVVISRWTVASVGVDEILATTSVVARIGTTFINILLAVDALVSDHGGAKRRRRSEREE